MWGQDHFLMNRRLPSAGEQAMVPAWPREPVLAEPTFPGSPPFRTHLQGMQTFSAPRLSFCQHERMLGLLDSLFLSPGLMKKTPT